MNGDLRNCPQCGRLFAYQGKNLCQKCLEKEDDEYIIVRRYVRDHPGASVFEVADATGVDEQDILRFLKDGLLHSRGFSASLECEGCGKRISEGRFCDSCRARLGAELKQAVAPRAKDSLPTSSEKMFIKKESRNKNQ
ncbi:MAG: TIGR03826 family flagellar region protein [Syntrophomonadaceae bacterium]|jgi:flagellar operon protein (TIGR03826 family)